MEADDPPRKKIKREALAEKGSMDPFRINIQQFLSEECTGFDISKLMKRGSRRDYRRTWLKMWYSNVSVGELGDISSGSVILEVFEENLVDLVRLKREDKNIYCHHCSYAGWGTHPVCSKRYHFIIRNNPKIHDDPSSIGIPEPQSLVDEDPNHLLHGLVHSNGFGHLVRLNGRQGGSKILTGSTLMKLWDNLCTYLGVRKISVRDVSIKHGMEYRLIHVISHGKQWYGNWGYEFGRGSFGLNHEAYEEALQTLSTESISCFFSCASSLRKKLQNIILSYHFVSKNTLNTVGDLFSYLSELLEGNHRHVAKSLVQTELPVKPFSWTEKDRKDCTSKILMVLEASGAEQWVPQWNLNGEIKHLNLSPTLVDYCLKHLAGKTRSGKVVVARTNKESGGVEYRFVTPQNDARLADPDSQPERDHILTDLTFLYNELLDPEKMQNGEPERNVKAARLAARRLLNSKILIKHYDSKCNTALSNQSVQMKCYMRINDQTGDLVCPPEFLTLLEEATVSDLKHEVTEVFKETYLSFDKVQVKGLADFKGVRENITVKELLGSQGVAHFNGGDIGEYDNEEGEEHGEVDCICGAKDDDGERMIKCDKCNIWKHTKCSQICDHEEVPGQYVCSRCRNSSRKKY